MQHTENEKHSSCCDIFGQIWCWFWQITLWTTLFVFLYVAIANHKDFMFFLTILGVTYVIYIINSLCSSTFFYLTSIAKAELIHKKMEKLFSTPAEIIYNCDCYHYETRTTRKENQKGEMETITEKSKVYSWKGSEAFRYYSCRDVSGLFLLDSHKVMRNQKMYIKLYLNLEIDFADAVTRYDYENQKANFCNRNHWRDTYMEFNENRQVQGFNSYNLVRISEFEVAYIGVCPYLLLTFLFPMVEFYKIYMNSFCIEQDFTIKKVISTRYNLNEGANIQLFQNSIPTIEVNDKKWAYAENTTVNEGNQPDLPSEEELIQISRHEESNPLLHSKKDL